MIQPDELAGPIQFLIARKIQNIRCTGVITINKILPTVYSTCVVRSMCIINQGRFQLSDFSSLPLLKNPPLSYKETLCFELSVSNETRRNIIASSSSMAMRIVVLNLFMEDDKKRAKAMECAGGFPDVESVTASREEGKITVIGKGIDSAELATRLRKKLCCYVDVVIVKTADEKKKEVEAPPAEKPRTPEKPKPITPEKPRTPEKPKPRAPEKPKSPIEAVKKVTRIEKKMKKD